MLVTDDAESFKLVAAALGLPQQVCKAHVQRNTDALVDALRPLAEHDADGSLARLNLSVEQAVADLERLHELIRTRLPEQEGVLCAAYQRYAQARSPQMGQTASLAYRLRSLFLDRWNLWGRLTRYRTWRGPQGGRCSTARTTVVSEVSAGGSRSAIAQCAATNVSSRCSM